MLLFFGRATGFLIEGGWDNEMNGRVVGKICYYWGGGLKKGETKRVVKSF